MSWERHFYISGIVESSFYLHVRLFYVERTTTNLEKFGTYILDT